MKVFRKTPMRRAMGLVCRIPWKRGRHGGRGASIGGIIGLITLSLVTSLSGSVYADSLSPNYVDQAGRLTVNESDMNGISAGMVANGDFNPGSNTCVLQSLVIDNGDYSLQIETGYARCNNATIDGTCDTGYRYVETITPSTGYTCYERSAFNNGVSHQFSISRPSGGSTFTVRIDSTTAESLSDFTNNAQGTAWMEFVAASSADTCSDFGPASGVFDSWEKTLGTTTTLATGDGRQGSTLDGDPSCWTIGPLDSNSDFIISK